MKIAMILAAGRGERLKPLTDSTPKALCMVRKKPLIEHHILALAKAGYERIVINHAYLGGKIRNYLGNGTLWGVEICYSPEPPGGLETAGGIINALPLLGSTPFLVVNGDIFTDFDFSSLNLHSIDFMHVTLTPKNPKLLHHGDFGLDGIRVTNNNRDYIYAGITVYHPKIFVDKKMGRYSLTPMLRDYVEQSKVTGTLYQGQWHDIGSLERLEAANA